MLELAKRGSAEMELDDPDPKVVKEILGSMQDKLVKVS
jgi:hypothetical protein